jgi:hypothetical protein
MPYFNFNFVTDPPNDETVNPVTQLNNNWQEVANKIQPFNTKPSSFSTNPPVGTEAFYPGPGDEHRIAVWDGAAWRRSLSHVSAWGSWQNLAIRSPRVERTGWTPTAKVDVVARRVVLSGGVLFNAAADPWPTASDTEITTDTAISTSLSPINNLTFGQVATGQVTTAGGFSSAVVKVERVSSPDRVAVYVRWQGDAGGGNFVMLDGLTWWY